MPNPKQTSPPCHSSYFLSFHLPSRFTACNSTMGAIDRNLDQAASFLTLSSSSTSTISPLLVELPPSLHCRRSDEDSVTLLLLGLHSVVQDVRGDCNDCSCFFLLSLTSACHCFMILAVCSSSALPLYCDPICKPKKKKKKKKSNLCSYWENWQYAWTGGGDKATDFKNVSPVSLVHTGEV